MTLAAATLRKLCVNVTSLKDNNATSLNDTSVEDARAAYLENRDRHAIVYIVVVLLFYSIGITIGIITYLKQEKEEIEEDKTYEDYMTFRSDPDKWSRYFSVQRMVTHLNRVEQERGQRNLKEKHLLQLSEKEEGDDAACDEGGVCEGNEDRAKGGKRHCLRLSLSPGLSLTPIVPLISPKASPSRRMYPFPWTSPRTSPRTSPSPRIALQTRIPHADIEYQQVRVVIEQGGGGEGGGVSSHLAEAGKDELNMMGSVGPKTSSGRINSC